MTEIRIKTETNEDFSCIDTRNVDNYNESSANIKIEPEWNEDCEKQEVSVENSYENVKREFKSVEFSSVDQNDPLEGASYRFIKSDSDNDDSRVNIERIDIDCFDLGKVKPLQGGNGVEILGDCSIRDETTSNQSDVDGKFIKK